MFVLLRPSGIHFWRCLLFQCSAWMLGEQGSCIGATWAPVRPICSPSCLSSGLLNLTTWYWSPNVILAYTAACHSSEINVWLKSNIASSQLIGLSKSPKGLSALTRVIRRLFQISFDLSEVTKRKGHMDVGTVKFSFHFLEEILSLGAWTKSDRDG